MVAGWSERQCPSLTHLPFIYSLHAVIAQNRWVQLSLGRHRTALLTVTLTSNPPLVRTFHVLFNLPVHLSSNYHQILYMSSSSVY